MAKIKIKIQDLFKKLGIDGDFENEESIISPISIKIKDHYDNFVIINEFVRKKIDSYITLFDNGLYLISSLEHIILTDNGEKKICEITDNDSIICNKGQVKIIYTKLYRRNDILYDFCLNEPHLFKDSNGIIHHNSLIISYIVSNLLHKGKQIIVVPSQSLVEQFYGDMEEYGMDMENIGRVYQKRKEWDKKIVISTWQTLSRNHTKLNDYYTIIVDECLDGDTLIKTIDGYKKIKNIIVGDNIISFNKNTNRFENDIVDKIYENMFISDNEEMYEIELENEKKLKITGNHKILTDKGYIKVKNLTKNDNLISFI